MVDEDIKLTEPAGKLEWRRKVFYVELKQWKTIIIFVY